MTDFQDRRISVIGAARSGVDAAMILARLGATVLLSDSQTADQLGAERLAPLHALGVTFVTHQKEDVGVALPPGTELVVTSPGVPRTAPVLQEAVQREIPIWSEIELAYRLAESNQVPIVAITGTNGKTTTTLLIAHILQAAGRNATVAGNISADEIKRTLVSAAFAASAQPNTDEYPIPTNTETPDAPTPTFPLLVAEISSFQLEWVERFAPRVAILTNVTPDHLNRHVSFEEYAQTKARIFAAQSPDDWAVLNFDNPAARQIGEAGVPGRRAWFTRQASPPDDGPCAWVQDGLIQARIGSGCTVAVLPVNALPPTLPGTHSVENVLAATLATLAVGLPAEQIAAGVQSFPGVAHRMEWVTDVAGIRYINNSMCTNVAAAVSSLMAMDRPTVVIAGGADKQLDYAPLAPALHARATDVVLIGQVADKMEAAFRAGGYSRLHRAANLETAVQMACALASPGEAVLLLPACASFDMFRDFEARGIAFRNAVLDLAKNENEHIKDRDTDTREEVTGTDDDR